MRPGHADADHCCWWIAFAFADRLARADVSDAVADALADAVAVAVADAVAAVIIVVVLAKHSDQYPTPNLTRRTPIRAPLV